MISVDTKIDGSIIRALRSAEPGPLRRMLRKSTKQAARPALDLVRAATPVKSGRLRASWSTHAFFDGRTGSVGVTIEPRSTFTFRDESGAKRLVTRRSAAHKSVMSAMGKGVAVDRATAWKYAFGIEMGHSPKGRLTRIAGGAKMLERSTRPGAAPFFATVSDDVRKHIASAV